MGMSNLTCTFRTGSSSRSCSSPCACASAGVEVGTGNAFVLIAGVASNTLGCSCFVSLRCDGATGVEGLLGVAGMIMDLASIGRIGRGARMGGDGCWGAGNVGAGGSAMVVAVAASMTLDAFSEGSRWCS